jgi:DNA helicase-2/ATP-dependent DNA helicase PcrA
MNLTPLIILDLIAPLNEQQKKAVLKTEGPLLVVAGAGSGKTKALTHRIAYLIQEKKVSPYNILAVTFTNKAATEMKERIEKLLANQRLNSQVTLGTFHSVCVRILRNHIHELDYENSFVIYDDSDQLVLVKKIMKELDIDEKRFNPRAILHTISQAKNQLIGPKQYDAQSADYYTDKVARVYNLYQANLRQNNALDFDDILMIIVELFQKRPNILEAFQDRYKYICVDEYQDTNHAQYVLIKQLADKHNNLCVIGDSDQSIYSWRGANMRNILDFEKDFPGAETVMLEQNYRSTKNILKAAHSVIVKNSSRKEKELWTENEDGDNIQVFEALNEKEEGIYIVNQINKALEEYESPAFNDFAVLYRTNAQSRVLEEIFMRFGIPYKIVGGTKFYARKEIKDIIAYLRVIHNPHDSVSLLRIINTPARKLGQSTLDKVSSFARMHGCSFYSAIERVNEVEELSDAKKFDLAQFHDLIREMTELSKTYQISDLIHAVVTKSGYKAMLEKEGSIEAEARMENINELMSVASKYDEFEEENTSPLGIFLEEVALISDLDKLNNDDNAVTLMTLHAAKGLEFRNVFMAGVEEGIFPHTRSMMDPEQMEEERRLMYVGVTRAEKKLHISYAKERMLYGQTQYNSPSCFVYDLPDSVVSSNSSLFESTPVISPDRLGSKSVPVENNSAPSEFADGDKVQHPTFGVGVVINSVGGVVTVAFGNGQGIKKLAISVAPLTKV